LDHSNRDILLDISEVLFDSGKADVAILTTSKGIEEQPENISLYYRLAALLYLTGKEKESLVVFEQAVSLDKEGVAEFFDFDTTLKDKAEFIEILNHY
jgi:tetratricopeptide (TPR) repeat protein